jgi:hypothetical protein
MFIFQIKFLKSDYESDPLSPPRGEATQGVIPLTTVLFFPNKKGFHSDSMIEYHKKSLNPSEKKILKTSLPRRAYENP